MRLFIAFLVVVAIGTAGHFPNAQAGKMPILMIAIDDSDPAFISKRSQITQRFQQALSAEMIGKGFIVEEELAKGLFNGRSSGSVEEFLEKASPSTEVMIIIHLQTDIKQLGYAAKTQTKAAGRLLDVRNKKLLGKFEVRPEKPSVLPANCNRLCLIEKVGKEAEELAKDVKVLLTTRLCGLCE